MIKTDDEIDTTYSQYCYCNICREIGVVVFSKKTDDDIMSVINKIDAEHRLRSSDCLNGYRNIRVGSIDDLLLQRQEDMEKAMRRLNTSDKN